MKDRASHDGKRSVPHTSADTSLRSTFPARSAASRAVRHASLKKRAFVPQDKSSFFVCHVNTMDQFPSWWHKTVPQRSGHSFEARSSGASSHFVPLHHDPATRSRCRSEETPRPAKRPRRKAGARAKRGVSELVPVAGLEPARHRWRWILSPLRLPIPSHRHFCVIIQHDARKFKKKLPKMRHSSDFICSLRCLQRSAREAAMFSF